jgi:hypothetical protein
MNQGLIENVFTVEIVADIRSNSSYFRCKLMNPE